MLHVDVRREDEDAHLRELLTDHARRFEALGRVRRRHPDVDEDQVRRLLANKREELRAVSGLPTTTRLERSRRLASPSRRSTSSSATMTRVPAGTPVSGSASEVAIRVSIR